MEAQHFGYQILQHVVQHRWDELPPDQRAQLSQLAIKLLDAACSAAQQQESLRVVRLKACQLVAAVIRQSTEPGMPLLRAVLEGAGRGAAHLEAACNVVQFVNEDVAILPDEDLPQSRKRELLSNLTASLPPVLQFLRGALEREFTAASQQAGQAAARPHLAAVSAALAALATYGEWAPVSEMHAQGITDACGFLVMRPETREDALGVLKAMSLRRTGNGKGGWVSVEWCCGWSTACALTPYPVRCRG